MVDSIQALLIFLYLLPGVVGYYFFILISEQHPEETFHRLTLIITLSFISTLLTTSILNVPVLPEIPVADQNNVAKIINNFFGKEFLATVGIAALLGGMSAFASNRNWISRLFFKLGLSIKTGKKDVWHQIFTQNASGKWCFIVFKNKNRLVGYPKYFSLDGSEKSLFIASGKWYLWDEKTAKYNEKEIDGPGVLLTNFDEILAIEILD